MHTEVYFRVVLKEVLVFKGGIYAPDYYMALDAALSYPGKARGLRRPLLEQDAYTYKGGGCRMYSTACFKDQPLAYVQYLYFLSLALE